MWWWSSAKVAKICSKDQFYYITEEHTEKGWFKISSCNTLQVTDRSVEKCPESGKFVAIPRAFIDEMKLSEDWLCKVRISRSGKSWSVDECCLGEFLDETTFKQAKHLTWAFCTGAEPCIDMDDHFLMISNSVEIPKFTCDDVLKELCGCLHKCLYQNWSYGSSCFLLEDETNKLSVTVTLRFTEELKNKLTGKQAGKIELPEKVEQVDEETD